MAELPQVKLLRRQMVLEYFGIDKGILKKWEVAGLLTPRTLRPGGRHWYLRSECVELDLKIQKGDL